MARCFVAFVLVLGLVACDPSGPHGDSAPEPLPPPGFEQLEPAVRAQFEARLERLRAARERGSDTEIGRLWGALGQWFHVYRFPDSALASYREAARFDTDEPRWPYYIGVLAVGAGDLAQAGAAFENAARLAPGSMPVAMQLAELMQKLGRTAQAEQHYREVLAIDARNPAPRFGLARLLLQQREAGPAVELLLPLAAGDGPESTELDYLLSQAYRLLGDAPRAQLHLERLPADHGNQTPIGAQSPWLDDLVALNVSSTHLTRLGMRAYRKGNFRQAAMHSGQAVASNPENAELRTNYAAALLALGRPGAALEQLEAALEREPGLARAHLVRGSSLLRLGDRDGAIDAFRRAVALDAGLQDARRQLALVYQRSGRTQLAVEQYAALRRAHREAHQVRFWHAALLASIGRDREALAALDEDLEIHPDNRLLELLRVRILATAPDDATRNPGRAAGLLAALDENPATDRLDVYFAESTAMVAAALGYHSQAVDWQRRAVAELETLRDGEPAQIARRRLTLYLEGKACRTPWETGESLITKPVEPPDVRGDWLAAGH